MDPEGGRTDPSVADLLFAEGYRFEFFQAVRILERLFPDRQPVGRASGPAREVVRFRSLPSLSFPASEVYEVRDNPDGPVEMTVAFMGLTGPSGALPRHYTEMIIERARRKDHVLHEFIDLFAHRLVSLFYRSWEKYRVTIAAERALLKPDAEDRFSGYVFDLFGLGTGGLQRRMRVADRVLLYYAGLLAQHRRSASALSGLLSDYFGVAVRVVQFVGQWLPLAVANRTRLGVRSWNGTLGVDAVAGSQVWDQQAKFRVEVGPLDFAAFCRFLPSGGAFALLVQLARFFAGQQFDFDVLLVLRADAVPACRLGGADGDGARLGWSAWLKTVPFARAARDAVFGGGLTRLGALPD